MIRPQEKKWFLNGKVNVLTVGRFESRKNHRLFLKAVSKLSQSYSVNATIIGQCTSENHQKEFEKTISLCKQLGLNEKVSFIINLPFFEVQKYYAKHDVFIFASNSDSAGIVLLEAMANSLPVVCSDAIGLQDYISRGKNGFVFKKGDLDDLVKYMDIILRDKENLVRMGENSYKLVVSKYNPERYVNTITTIIKKHSSSS